MKHETKLQLIIFLLFILLVGDKSICSSDDKPFQIYHNQKSYPLYPKILDQMPDVPSPFRTEDGMEVVIAFTKKNKFALIPVTVENGNPLLYSRKIKSLFGKDHQLVVDLGDFPDLAKTGLHNEQQLNGKTRITGIPVEVITYIGRPGRFSGAGFMAHDEDIISVLKGDNRLVRKLNLTHSQMAKPLFHIWNIILKEIELKNWVRFWDNIQYVFYNGRKIKLNASGTKGWQVSIFQDEIQGTFSINIQYQLSLKEKLYVEKQYSHLSKKQMTELEKKLCSIHFSEMAPYYIMRYGFYEGHTDYRADPIAIAFVFGLRSLKEIDNIFQGKLYKALSNHFVETVKKN